MIKYVLFLTVCYTVHCVDQIRMQRDFRRYGIYNEFPIYWNVPSFMCNKHGIDYSEYTQRYGIIANPGDSFRGNKVNILYDPGAYPAYLKKSSGGVVERNGGIPQHGNLTFHLELIKSVVEQLIPPDYCSMACLDFEAYRPIFRQNWNEQEIYTNMSKEDVRQKHPQWDEKTVSQVAADNFERSSRVFLETTLKLLKEIRPCAQWGYYGFPYCFNFRRNSGMVPWCHKDVQVENNQYVFRQIGPRTYKTDGRIQTTQRHTNLKRIQWLFDSSKALYPSLYLGKTEHVDAKQFVIGRMNEAVRVAFRSSPGDVPQIHPYMWYKYHDSTDFLSEYDFYTAMETVRKYKVGGYVLWGASNDFTTKEKCQSVLSYLIRVIGPAIERVRMNARKDHYNRPNDEQIDFHDLEDSQNSQTFKNFDKNRTNFYYNYSDGESKPKPTLEIIPNENPIIIYSAIGQNGTKTIYQYDTDAKYEVNNEIPASNDLKYSIVTESSRTRPKPAKPDRTVRGNNPNDLPYLRAYVNGFNKVLEMMLKRFT